MSSVGITVVLVTAPSHSSVGKVETVNRILQDALKKSVTSPCTWDLAIPSCLRSVNTRCIKTPGYSPFEILHGCCPLSSLSSQLGSLAVDHLRKAIRQDNFQPLESNPLVDTVAIQISRCLAVAIETRDVDQRVMDLRKERRRKRTPPFGKGDLVMLEQEGWPIKLEPK